MSKISEIVKQLQSASDAYYNGDSPVMSDQEYDRLRDMLEELDPKNPFLSEVGAPSNALSKVTHIIPMGSLKKINNPDEYQTWLKTITKQVPLDKLELSSQFKMDGISLELIYKDGKFVQAVTRGDGIQGDDVTHTIKKATGFPRKIDYADHLSVRCEAVLSLSNWKKHFSDSTANPRNAVSGLVRRTDSQGAEHIQCFAFDAVKIENNAPQSIAATESEKLAFLFQRNFNVVQDFHLASIENMPKFVNNIVAKRDTLDFEIDGLVVKCNQIEHQELLGEHDGRPYWARAWKFPPMGGHTVLREVIWNVGAMGSIHPVGVVDDVKVGGTTIRNVTLHNMDEIERLGLHIEDTIEIVRAGDVIPKVIRVVKPGVHRKKISISKCPSCGSTVDRDGPKIMCSKYENCDGVAKKKIEKWISKRNIMFLGDATLDTLYSQKVISSVVDLYSLTIEKLVKAGLGERMSEKILEEVEKSRTVVLPEFLGSLSIDMLGVSESTNLFEAGFKTLNDWYKLVPADLEKLDGYQSTKAKRICEGLKSTRSTIDALSRVLNIKNPTIKKTGGKLAGMSFCFTGSMNKSRKELEKLVENCGGEAKDSVDKGLNYLVMSDPNSQSSKAVKARKYGTKVISEQEFLDMTN